MSVSVELFPTIDPQNAAEKRALDGQETVSQDEVLLFYKHTMLIAIYIYLNFLGDPNATG